MSNYILIAITIILLVISSFKSKEKTIKALKKAWKSFSNIAIQLLTIVLFVGIILSFFNAETISLLIGKDSGFFGVLIAAVAGSITLIPGFVAFPMAAMLLDSNAGYMQIAAFISTLMMVGIVTIPLEIKYFKSEVTYKRNFLAFIFSLLIAVFMGVLL